MLPDPLQFFHGRFPSEPFRTLQRFHRWMHTDRKIEPGFGIGSQLALVALVVAATMAAHRGVLDAAIAMAQGSG
jgi:hypothetical protein